MKYTIELLPHAQRDLKALDRSVQKRIAKSIDELETNPRPPGCKKMEGLENAFRIRTGDYRIIYRIQDEKLVVLIIKVGHRRDIYR